MPKSDPMGDRLKVYEMAEAGRALMPLLPVIARIDGRCFSTFTSGMDRPYDKWMSAAMINVTHYLAKETHATLAYTQSDEISLAWPGHDQPLFGGRTSKLCSVLAAMASVEFNLQVASLLSEYASRRPIFDCRVWNVPNEDEGANTILWREFDATKNAVSMAARSVYSHKELHGKTANEMQEMLWQRGINFNDYPAFFKRGTFIQRRVTRGKPTLAELDALPEKHHARSNPDFEIERTSYIQLVMPQFSKVVNRVGVIFRGDVPQTA